MVDVKDKGLLLQIIDHSLRIEKKIEKLDKDDFYENRDNQDIVCFNVLQIGELVAHFSMNLTKIYSNIPWKKIKGLRDIIVHGYGTIDWDRLWETATNDIKPLREYCEQILNENK